MKVNLACAALALMILTAPALYPATIYVPDNYTLIQDAIDAAQYGDTIIVRPDTYTENLFIPAKELKIRSEQGPEVTIIDGMQSGTVVVFDYGVSGATELDGFTIRNGAGQFDHRRDRWLGGGIYEDDAKPMITNNIITENYGVGILCDLFSIGTITNNVISFNTDSGIDTQDSGGTIRGNLITGNGGAGISMAESSPVIEDNEISDNSGGGIRGINGGGFYETKVIGNLICRNSGGQGGGIYFTWSTSTLVNNVICLNTASQGGCAYFEASEITMTNNTVFANTAGEGGGIYATDSDVVITNCILWEDSASVGKEIYLTRMTENPTLTISYSDLQDGRQSVHVDPGCILDWGPGMISRIPRFFDPGGCDFGIMQRSPCRNAGTNSAPALPSVDFEGEPRIVESIADIGADEFYFGPELPVLDIKCNGEDEAVVIALGDHAVLTIDLESRDYAGYRVDVWVLVRNGDGFKRCYSGGRWWPNWNRQYFTGVLYDFEEVILDYPLPTGSYEALFGVDVRPNGYLNTPRLWCEDRVDFSVQP